MGQILNDRLKASEGMTEEIALRQVAACEGVTLSDYAKKRLAYYDRKREKEKRHGSFC